MDFNLTDEQELIVASYRDYMESENWETYFHECDEKHEYPLRWAQGLCEMGFDRIMLDEEHGGLGLEQPITTLMAIYEVLGQYGAPTYVLYLLTGYNTIVREGTQEQIDACLKYLGTGEQVVNSACTEPGAGSDVSGLVTTYKRENGKIYLNGTKTFITSSKGVKYLIIMCRDADNPDVISEFFVDMSKPGISLSPLTKLGLRMDSCCEVYLDNVEMEEKDFFGKEGNGFNRGVADFNFERWLVRCVRLRHGYLCFRRRCQACLGSRCLRQAGRSLPAELPEVLPHGHQARLHAQHALRSCLERRHQPRRRRRRWPGCNVQVLLRQRFLRGR